MCGAAHNAGQLGRGQADGPVRFAALALLCRHEQRHPAAPILCAAQPQHPLQVLAHAQSVQAWGNRLLRCADANTGTQQLPRSSVLRSPSTPCRSRHMHSQVRSRAVSFPEPTLKPHQSAATVLTGCQGEQKLVQRLQFEATACNASRGTHGGRAHLRVISCQQGLMAEAKPGQSGACAEW